MPSGGRRDGAGRKKKIRPFADGETPTLAVDKPPTEDERRDFVVYLGDGLTVEQIAKALGTDVATLNVRFASELENGAAQARVHNLARLRAAADAGNVTAMKKLDEILVSPPALEPPPSSPQLGKKEAANAAAQDAEAGTGWDDLVNEPRLPFGPN